MTEEQIIDACRKGDSFAQKMLFELYCDKLFMICIRYIPQQHLSEEIVSDTFLKCFQALKNFEYRGEGSLRAWLSRVAVNECLMFLRKQKSLVFSTEEYLPEKEDRNENAIERISAKELISHIQQLPEGYRMVFNMFVLEGFSHKEIANQLDISENTSKSQLRKAKLFLQKQINANEQLGTKSKR